MDNKTVQDVFTMFYGDYREVYRTSPRQEKVAYHIMNCKTGAFGSNTSKCGDCGHSHVHHNSCRDRSCPMCQELPKEKWIDRQKENLLDAPYFHVVFTLPEELNPLIYCNQKELYHLLYQTSAETLKELAADPEYLGAEIGFLSVLHTWGSSMCFHPHLHMVVLGGGLDQDKHFKESSEDFFLPVRVISNVFRGKYMEGIKKLLKSGSLVFEGSAVKYRNRYELQDLLDTCYGKGWIPYCKKTFRNAEAVLEYLGRYTHRIAISNRRILKIEDGYVTYRIKDYRAGGKWKETRVSGVEFIRRFLLHVLPKQFVRIRHYGLFSSRGKGEKISLCRNLIGCRKYLSELRDMNTAEILYKLFGVDISVCPVCGSRNYGSKKTVRRMLLISA